MSSPEPVAPLALPAKRRVVFVVGAGRSGLTSMAATLQALGLQVPTPEVAPDGPGLRGRGESQWVLDLHAELLERCNVQVADSRPAAWYETGKLSNYDPLRTRVTGWLEAQFEFGPELVVKDPSLAWFTGLWRSAALRCGATPSFVIMLRPPTEVVGSEQRSYAARAGEVQRTAAWLNAVLHTERATRGSGRRFVRYADLLDDWTRPVFDLGRGFDLAGVQGAQANDIRAVHALVDPALHRVRLGWDDVDVPARLRALAEQTWQRLDASAEPGGDSPPVHDELDRLRVAYADVHDEAEAVAISTALAAHHRGLAQGRVEGRDQALAEATAGRSAVSTAAAGARRNAERVPHRLRALVPAGVRRGLRRLLGRQRADH